MIQITHMRARRTKRLARRVVKNFGLGRTFTADELREYITTKVVKRPIKLHEYAVRDGDPWTAFVQPGENDVVIGVVSDASAFYKEHSLFHEFAHLIVWSQREQLTRYASFRQIEVSDSDSCMHRGGGVTAEEELCEAIAMEITFALIHGDSSAALRAFA